VTQGRIDAALLRPIERANANLKECAVTTLIEPAAPWLRELNRLFTADAAVVSFLPPADVLVTDDAVDVYMDVPGVGADSLAIELENETLTVRGDRAWPYGSQDGPARRIERRFGRFERSLRVPPGLDADAIEATLRDGVLSLHIPMPKAVRPQRVQIRAADSTEAPVNDGPESQPQMTESPATTS
jgi:HSP20 family protein